MPDLHPCFEYGKQSRQFLAHSILPISKERRKRLCLSSAGIATASCLALHTGVSDKCGYAVEPATALMPTKISRREAMNWKSTVLPFITCLCIVSGGASPVAAEPAIGERGTAQGVSCDTEERARQFLTLWDGTNGTEVLTQMNTSAGAPVCLAGTIVFELKSYSGYVENKVGTWRVAEMDVFGVIIEGSGMRFAQPLKQYTGFAVKKAAVRGSSI